MASLLLECAIRAALIGAATATVLWAMRIRAAAVRHAAWTVVVVAMLLLPVWSVGGLTMPLPVLQPSSGSTQVAAVPVEPTPIGAVPVDAITPDAPATAEPARAWDWPAMLTGLYVLGVFVLLARLSIGTVYATVLRRSAVIASGRLTSGRCATPITVGCFRPVLILPSAWQQWPAAQLDAVLTHEGEHARRRDPLVQWLALFNRAVFWFHPLAWWLERRLAMLAEEACDAAVLAAGHSPQEYSNYLLDLARSLTREGRRLNVVGMAMPGGGLTQRLHRILDGPLPPRMSRGRVVGALGLCAVSTIMSASGTLTSKRSPQIVVDQLERPRSNDSLIGQAPAPTVPRFEVVSVKPCKADDLPPGARGAGPLGPSPSPGRLHMDCVPLVGANGLIRRAYGTFASGVHNAYLNPAAVPVEGGPAWVRSDRYTIEAKAEGTPPMEMMMGPMLQALLEDRFHLRVRRETRDVPVYDLTIARSGSKLKPFDGRCKPVDFTKGNIPAQLEAEGSCPVAMRDTRVDAPGQSIGDFITFVLTLLDRPVVDKTGLAGRFDIRLDFSPDVGTAITDVTATLAVAMQQQLGLKLTPATGPGQFLVIDHVERPTSNEVGSPAPSGAQTRSIQPAKFDVVSVKQCAPNSGPGPGQRGAGSPNSPGYLYLTCLTLRQLVNMSSEHANDKLNILIRYRQENGFYPVRGGPSWVESDQFTIEGRAAGVTDRDLLTGPMLRALLDERFQLKTHAATEDLPIYVLKVSAGGLKIAPLPPGTCYDLDPGNILPPDKRPGRICGYLTEIVPLKSVGVKLGKPPLAGGLSLSDNLSELMDRAVIDQTGLDDWYDIGFDYTPDERTPRALLPGRDGGPPPAGSGPNIFKALENLGLKLEPAKWPMPYLVIDRAEKPRPNSPSPIQ